MSDGPRIGGPRAGGLTPAVAPRVRALLAAAVRPWQAAAARGGPALAFLALLACWLVAYLDRAFRTTTLFPGYEGDGPFQLFNPLRRIAAGQTGGVDFQYFHGLGFPYLHYPVFALAGKDVYAGELARHLVTIAASLVTVLAVGAAVTRRFTGTLVLATGALVLCDQLNLYSMLLPANGSAGVRCAAPFLIFAALVAGLRPRLEAVLVGLLAGCGLLVGVEHGVASLVMVGFVWLARMVTRCPGGTLRWAATAAAVFAVTFGGGLLLIGGPAGAVAALRFAFAEMPQDQFWYFGAPPNPFLYSWADVVTNRGWLLKAVGPLAVVGVLAIRHAKRNPAERSAATALLGLVVYGFVSTAAYFGYSSQHYLEPATRVAVTAGLVLAWWAWVRLEQRGPDAESQRRLVRWGVAGAAAVILLVGPSFYDPSSILDLPKNARNVAAGFATVRAGQCKMTPKIQAELDHLVAAIDADRAAKGVARPPVIWSTYAGRLEDHYGVFHPVCDYAIHALGPKRRAEYLDGFRTSRPDYVVTCRPSQYGYEGWLQNGSWDFYEEVVLNYSVLTVGERFAVWVRSSTDWRTPDHTDYLTKEPDGPDWFTVPAPPGTSPDQPRVVEVEYELRNPLAGVPVFGNMPRHLLGPADCLNGTTVTLPPYRKAWSFAVYPVAGKTPRFFGKTFSLVGGGLTITRVHIRPLAATPQQVFALTN
jgi:hypothetical protein